MKERHPNLERFNAFSGGIFGVLITILVLDLKAPDRPTPDSFLALWPTGLSHVHPGGFTLAAIASLKWPAIGMGLK